MARQQTLAAAEAPTPANDAELLRRYVRERAEDAFAELVRRYVALVYHAAMRQVGGDPDAAEVVRNAWSRSLRRYQPLSNPSHPDPESRHHAKATREFVYHLARRLRRRS